MLLAISFRLCSADSTFASSVPSADPYRIPGDSTVPLDREPELVTFVKAPYPAEQARKDIEGSVVLNILVNESGLVDSVAVVKGVSPPLDSAAKAAALKFVFTPGQSQNKPVAVMLQFQYHFSLKQLLDSIQAHEDLIGCVRREQTNKPIAGAMVEVSFLDSLCETEPAVPIRLYLEKIGTFHGQRLENGHLIAETDSLGRFSFKSLPPCRVIVRIGGLGLKTTSDTIVIRPGEVTRTTYRLQQSLVSQNEIVAYGHLTQKKINVEKEEKTYGRTDDLNNLLTAQSGVTSVPKAQSLLLVNGDGPYDNCFMLRGIPIFIPSHFAGVSYFDRSIFSLGTPLDIEFLTTGISGLYSGGSGSVLRIDPGILHDPIHVARPELLVNYGTLGADLTLSVPVRRGDDLYQISYRPSDKYALWFLNEYKTVDNNLPAGYSAPTEFTDVQFLGSQKAGKARIRELVWLSEDIYNDSAIRVEKVIPWGICIASLDSLPLPWCRNLSAGGAWQHWFESEPGVAAYSKDVERRSLALSGEGPTFSLGSGRMTTNLMMQYVPWTGRVLLPGESTGPLTLNADSIIAAGYQGEIRAGQSYGRMWGNLQCGLNVCEGLCFPMGKCYVDPGFWLLFPFGKNSLKASAGLITSQPDIRGMPSQSIDRKLIQTCNTSSKILLKSLTWLEGALEGFVKYRPYQLVYSQNPRMPIWDENSNDQFFSAGINAEIKANLGKRISMRTVQSVSKSVLINHGRQEPYEWDMPWTNKTIISYSLIDTMLTAFLIGNFYAGLPYHTAVASDDGLSWSEGVKRKEDYNRVDLKIQLCEPVSENRTLMQYDVYLLFSDLTGLFYDPDGRGGMTFDNLNVLYHVHLGARVHLRF
jgi:TonB family protein